MPDDSGSQKPNIEQHLKACGVSRRNFLQLCTALMVTAPAGLAFTKGSVLQVAQAVGKAKRPSVVWLHFQDCTGCSETLLRTSRPDLADLILNVISLDYHETLMAASGKQAEASLKQAVAENFSKFVLVVEGLIPTKEQGRYMMLGGRPALEVLKDVGSKSAAVIAMGSCAAWGGVPSADPNPTGAIGVDSILKEKPVVNIPGCPTNPYNLLAVVLEYATMGRLPALDEFNRPKFAFDRFIHDHCPRRAHFDAGRFTKDFGDEGHRQGWCLYKMGCKGPVTHAACSTRHFNEVPDVWPIGVGAPCVGCTEKDVAFRVPIFQTVDIHAATPPEALPLINTPIGSIGTVAAAMAGAIAGGIGGAALMASRRLPRGKDEVAGNDGAAGKPDNRKDEGEAGK